MVMDSVRSEFSTPLRPKKEPVRKKALPLFSQEARGQVRRALVSEPDRSAPARKLLLRNALPGSPTLYTLATRTRSLHARGGARGTRTVRASTA